MPLDYNNLPPLLTIEDIAEIYRCSTGTIRRRMKVDPMWLRPVHHGLMRRKLYATTDVLKRLGRAAPEQAPTPITPGSWTPSDTEQELEAARLEQKARQWEARHRRYYEARDELLERIRTHRPTARLFEIAGFRTKLRKEISPDGESFRLTFVLQPRFRIEGWQDEIQFPRAQPGWVRLETDQEMRALKKEVDAVFEAYHEAWNAHIRAQREVRKAAKKKAGT